VESKIVKVELEDNNIEKYQIVTGFDWQDLIFKSPPFDKKTIKAMARLYDVNIIPKDPEKYGNLIFYNINEKEYDLDRNTEIGYIFNNQILLNYYFNKARDEDKIIIENGKFIFEDKVLNDIFIDLKERDRIAFAKGEKNTFSFFPVSSDLGYLSDIQKSKLLVNSHFFLMDETDIDSLYDEIGTPHGFAMYKSKIFIPPLNHRKSLVVDNNNNVNVEYFHVTDFILEIDNEKYIHNNNSKIYTRPDYRETPKCKGVAIIVVKNKVVAIKKGGNVVIPMAGYVIQIEKEISLNSLDVKYIFEKQYLFAVQVGPTMISNHNQFKDFDTPFYIGNGTPFPSTVYPLDFVKGRAARIGLGTYKNEPILIWAEGAGKLGHIKGDESCGASLLEFSNFCKDYGIKNLINLDGGGSAQLIFNNKKELKIADRHIDKVSEAERPIPYALIIE